MPSSVEPIPRTTIPTKFEVNLRRLLSVCENQVSHENGLIRGPEKLKFVTNIKHLKNLLEQIEMDATSNVDKTAISEYARKIQRLSDIVDEFKLISPVNRTFSQARFTKNAYQSQNEKNKENELELKLAPQTNDNNNEPEGLKSAQEKRLELFSSDAINRSEIRQRRTNKFDQEETTNIESVLQYHRQTQEELTQDLVKMAERLKMNSITFGDIIKRDEKILDQTQSVLGSNLDRLKKEGTRLGRYAGKSSKTTWLVWSVVVFVCFSFFFTFMLIRVFKAPRA
ncbi:11218_t:CDS:2 [Ambispora gerdemannii]|uniref:11218_t:CDS:1 n=1 Tax=Ambispora gerdemannii TaxID=144530 RepID=A0A9N8Z0N9_9GLOM|nr:11218_t:CDS:2 [Ambispora gerdemannii]